MVLVLTPSSPRASGQKAEGPPANARYAWTGLAMPLSRSGSTRRRANEPFTS